MRIGLSTQYVLNKGSYHQKVSPQNSVCFVFLNASSLSCKDSDLQGLLLPVWRQTCHRTTPDWHPFVLLHLVKQRALLDKRRYVLRTPYSDGQLSSTSSASHVSRIQNERFVNLVLPSSSIQASKDDVPRVNVSFPSLCYLAQASPIMNIILGVPGK